MARRPKNKGQFRKKRFKANWQIGRRKPKLVRFETRNQRKRDAKRTLLVASAAFLSTFAAGIAFLWFSADRAPPERAQQFVSGTAEILRPRIGLCEYSQIQDYCVIDGDTIKYAGETIRIADIDTPEIFSPKCPSELQRGNAAKLRLMAILREGPFEIERIGFRDEDQYGRKLRVLTRNGQSIGDMLVREGLARTWTGRREPWC